jgi:hypothetical protein
MFIILLGIFALIPRSNFENDYIFMYYYLEISMGEKMLNFR